MIILLFLLLLGDEDDNIKYQITSSGVLIEFFDDGTKKQTRVTGECLLTLLDGTKISTRKGSPIKITQSPGGYTLQEDSSTNIKIHR